jgi:hypothetical protein
LFKSTDGIDLNNVTSDDLPTALANLRKFVCLNAWKWKKKNWFYVYTQAIIRIRELLKELEIKESINNETVQSIKQEFNEHKSTSEKVKKYNFYVNIC